jgi:hypothetical protein
MQTVWPDSLAIEKRSFIGSSLCENLAIIACTDRTEKLRLSSIAWVPSKQTLNPEVPEGGGRLGADSDHKWSARLEMCQWIRETLDKESVWDEARSTSLSRW